MYCIILAKNCMRRLCAFNKWARFGYIVRYIPTRPLLSHLAKRPPTVPSSGYFSYDTVPYSTSISRASSSVIQFWTIVCPVHCVSLYVVNCTYMYSTCTVVGQFNWKTMEYSPQSEKKPLPNCQISYLHYCLRTVYLKYVQYVEEKNWESIGPSPSPLIIKNWTKWERQESKEELTSWLRLVCLSCLSYLCTGTLLCHTATTKGSEKEAKLVLLLQYY